VVCRREERGERREGSRAIMREIFRSCRQDEGEE